ncbi:hypothetical protein TruAng_012097 [Truncatella angustata]|nr:hypothetical protein TruAng_012097 [Truncatella angustata]
MGLLITTTSEPGTVSSLTPAQRSRKRAKDREAQRSIRTRTKQHIKNLEQEISQLRILRNQPESKENMLRKNKSLKEELNRLNDHGNFYKRTTNLPSTSKYPALGLYEWMVRTAISRPTSGSLNSSFGLPPQAG